MSKLQRAREVTAAASAGLTISKRLLGLGEAVPLLGAVCKVAGDILQCVLDAKDMVEEVLDIGARVANVIDLLEQIVPNVSSLREGREHVEVRMQKLKESLERVQEFFAALERFGSWQKATLEMMKTGTKLADLECARRPVCSPSLDQGSSFLDQDSSFLDHHCFTLASPAARSHEIQEQLRSLMHSYQIAVGAKLMETQGAQYQAAVDAKVREGIDAYKLKLIQDIAGQQSHGSGCCGGGDSGSSGGSSGGGCSSSASAIPAKAPEPPLPVPPPRALESKDVAYAKWEEQRMPHPSGLQPCCRRRACPDAYACMRCISPCVPQWRGWIRPVVSTAWACCVC